MAYWLYLRVTGKDPQQVLQRHIDRLIEANKDKAPVVYLRSFAAEGETLFDRLQYGFTAKNVHGLPAYHHNVGHAVTDVLRVIGPPVELSRKAARKAAEPFVGYRRASAPKQVSVDDRDWQQTILAWLPGAALVVVQLDVSAGLGWELEQLVRKVRPTRILLVLPPTQHEYGQARDWAGRFFPAAFPAHLPLTRLMTFRPDWQPLPIEPLSFWIALRPLFQQNGYEAPPVLTAAEEKERAHHA